MSKPYAVVFAGVPGSSKSIVAHYLSETFGLPIFSNDNLRYEVREDLKTDNINQPRVLAEYEKRLKQRRQALLATKRPVILDGSVDRRWAETKQQLQTAGYDRFLINMELSKKFITELFSHTARPKSIKQLPAYLQQHRDFVKQFKDDISLQITDETFPDRLQIAADGLQKFIDGQQ